MPETDAELIIRAKNGDRPSFDELVRRHYTLVFNVAYRMLNDRDLASDAVQGAFVRAYKAVPRFRSDASFTTWLYRITTNVCLDQLRGRERTEHSLTLLSEDETDGAEQRDIPDTSDDPGLRAEQRERQELVQSALARLAPEHRQVLVMYDLTGLSYEEIAEVLGVPIGTVKSRLNRARHSLKGELEKHMELFQ